MRAWRSLKLPSPHLTGTVADVLVVAVVVSSFILDGVPEGSDRVAWHWVAAVSLTAAALLLRRRFPLLALGGVLALWLAVHTPQAGDDPPFQFIALLVAAYALGAHAPRRRGLAGLVVAVAVFSVLNLDRGEGIAAAVAGTIQFSVMFTFGVLISGAARRERTLRERAVRLESERDERARAAVADERARIARDLHDSLGHTISAIVLQVAAVRRRLEDHQDAERDSLLTVERSGRDSVTELRRMLGLLRETPGGNLEPVPSLARLDELARTVRAAGVPVKVLVEGDRSDVPAGVDVAAYRIVQEALTNVLKHAHGARAAVRVTYGRDEVAVEVVDEGVGARANGHGELGHGLIGMRERAALYGGELEAGAREGGGFRVAARLRFARDEMMSAEA